MEKSSPQQPSTPVDPIANFSHINALNEQIADQNDRLSIFSLIDDVDFKKLAEDGLVAEQTQTMTALADVTTRIPYAELGQQSLIASQEIGRLAASLAGVDTEIAGIERMTALTVKIAPGTSEQVAVLAAAKIAEITAKYVTPRDRMNKLINANDQLFTLAGRAWPVPVVAQSLRPNTAVESVTPQAVPVKAAFDTPTVVTEPNQVESVSDTSDMLTSRAERFETILDSVLWAVYAYAESNPWLSMEEARDAIPELSQLTREEYQYFRASFPKVRQQIITTLAEKGVEAFWQQTGSTRDKRYNLVFEADKSLVISKEIGSSLIIPKQPKQSAQHPSSVIDKTPEAIDKAELLKTPLIKQTITFIKALQDLNEAHSLKRTYLAKQLSDELGIPVTETALLLSDLLKVGLLHGSGSQDGTRLLTIDVPKQEVVLETVKPEACEQAAQVDEYDLLTQVEADVEIAKTVFSVLPVLKRVKYRFILEDIVTELHDKVIHDNVVRSSLLRLIDAKIFDIGKPTIKNGIISQMTIGFATPELLQLANEDIAGLLKITEEALLQQAITQTITSGQE